MGIVDRRLRALEEQFKVPSSKDEDERLEAEHREFYARLTDEELDWLLEPADEADFRRSESFEGCPQLAEEFGRRFAELYERRDEILQREPEDFATSWRRRYGIDA